MNPDTPPTTVHPEHRELLAKAIAERGDVRWWRTGTRTAERQRQREEAALRRALLEAWVRTELGRREDGRVVPRTRRARIIPTSFSVRRGQAGDQSRSPARRAPLVATIESGTLQVAHGDVDVLAVE